FGFAGSYWIAKQINTVVFQRGNMLPTGVGLRTKDIWFDAELANKIEMLSDRWANQRNFNGRHPLYQGFSFLSGYLLKTLAMKPFPPVRAFSAIMASLWVFAVYALLRLITGCRVGAFLICLLGMTSASGMFFLGLPETFTLGSATIVASLCLA